MRLDEVAAFIFAIHHDTVISRLRAKKIEKERVEQPVAAQKSDGVGQLTQNK